MNQKTQKKNSLGLNSCFLDLDNPFELFKIWMKEAEKKEENDPNALSLATANKNGAPSVRIVLLKDINDGLEDAKDLYNFTKHVPSKVNLIEYNLVDGLDYDKSSVEKLNLFIEYLERRGLNVGIRRSRGEDINAACGQLANKN